MFEKMVKCLGDLPMASATEQVVEAIMDNKVCIVSAETGSGKSLLTPAAIAEYTGLKVVVCVPRRFLAVNAAETVAELSGLTVGLEVGYAVGRQSGEESQFCDQTKVLIVTYGYAIKSGLIKTAQCIVFDEVHEVSMDMSIARALAHKRIKDGESLMLTEMSATINAERQANYWSDVAKTVIVGVEGKKFSCEHRHVNTGNLETITNQALNLVKEGRKGIVIFRPGVGEVEETVKLIRELQENEMRVIADNVGHNNPGVNDEDLAILVQEAQQKSPLHELEVAAIYGEMDYNTRKQAVAKPENGNAKILVGTNVVESGVNIVWLDAAISCGTGKEKEVTGRNGTVALKLIDLPRWRLKQQEGRVTRFCDAIFILCSEINMETRPMETSPEIRRLPLTELVMHCASFELKASDLKFDYAPEMDKLVQAESKLQLLGMLNDHLRLTDAGRFVSDLPVSTEVGAMLWHAKTLGVLGAALTLAAVIDTDGVRKDFRYPHNYDDTSDWFDGLKAYKAAQALKGVARTELMEEKNIGYKRFTAVQDTERALLSVFNGQASSTMVASDDDLRQCLLAGYLDSFFPCDSSGVRGYRLGNGSAVPYLRNGFVLCGFRKITPKKKDRFGSAMPFTIVEKVTFVKESDIMALAKKRPDIFTIKRSEAIWGELESAMICWTTYYLGNTIVKSGYEPALDAEVQKPKPIPLFQDDRSYWEHDRPVSAATTTRHADGAFASALSGALLKRN